MQLTNNELTMEVVSLDSILDIDKRPLEGRNIATESVLKIKMLDPVKKRAVILYAIFELIDNPLTDKVAADFIILYNKNRYGDLDYISEPLKELLGHEFHEFIEDTETATIQTTE